VAVIAEELMYGAVDLAGRQCTLSWSSDCVASTPLGPAAAGGLMTSTGIATVCETTLSCGASGYVDTVKVNVSI
jgi:hypothetical protein